MDVNNFGIDPSINLVKNFQDNYHKTLRSNCYVLGVSKTAVSAKNSMCGIKNPASSGKVLVMEQLVITTDSESNVVIKPESASGGTTGLNGSNKFLGGSAGVGIGETNEYDSTLFPTYGKLSGVNGSGSGRVPSLYTFTSPYIVPENYTFYLVCLTLNVTMVATFFWSEEDV